MRIEHSGNATVSTLSASITDSDVTISCVDLTNWSDGSIGDFYGSINKGTGTEEKIRFSGRTGNVLAVAERGVDGTTAQSHAINSSIEHVWTAVEADEANAHQEAGSGAHGYPSIASLMLTTGAQDVVGTKRFADLIVDGPQELAEFRVRNIYVGTGAPDNGDGEDGDIYIDQS